MRTFLFLGFLCSASGAYAQTTTTQPPASGPPTTSTTPAPTTRDDEGVLEQAKAASGILTRDMTVKLLNEGGKRVVIDNFKHIPQGGECAMAKDSTIMRVGAGNAGMVRVRYVGVQMQSGGCPFMTEFEISEPDFKAANDSFRAQWSTN